MKHEGPAHIQRSPVSASYLERRDLFPAWSGKNSRRSRRISRGGALHRKGESKKLKELMAAFGGDAMIFDEYPTKGRAVSSTLIRGLLVAGDCARANQLLGEPYFLTGVVSHGDGRGRTLGLPTVNTDIPETKLQPKAGVYRSRVMIDGAFFDSVTNIGTCPTFAEREIHAETYIVNYSGNLYGEKIRIFFLGYLREEKKFESPNELIMQINVDKKQAIQENGDLTWQAIGQN